MSSANGYKSVYSLVTAWTNTLTSSFDTVVSSNDAYKGESALFKFQISALSGKQTYVNIKIDPLFTELTTPPTDATLISGYEVRYNITG